MIKMIVMLFMMLMVTKLILIIITSTLSAVLPVDPLFVSHASLPELFPCTSLSSQLSPSFHCLLSPHSFPLCLLTDVLIEDSSISCSRNYRGILFHGTPIAQGEREKGRGCSRPCVPTLPFKIFLVHFAQVSQHSCPGHQYPGCGVLAMMYGRRIMQPSDPSKLCSCGRTVPLREHGPWFDVRRQGRGGWGGFGPVCNGRSLPTAKHYASCDGWRGHCVDRDIRKWPDTSYAVCIWLVEAKRRLL